MNVNVQFGLNLLNVNRMDTADGIIVFTVLGFVLFVFRCVADF